MSGAPGGSLRVLVNLSWLVPGVVGGSEQSTIAALAGILDHHREIELGLAVLRPFLSAHPDLADRCRCEVLDLGGGSKVARVLAEQTWLARRAEELGVDLVHHAGGTVPLRHRGPLTLTIHDLQPLDLPANFTPAKRAYMRLMLGRSARAAELVCVPSVFTASRVSERLGIPAGKIAVVPWSAGRAPDDPRTYPPPPDAPVFLYPAITYPHKNHLMLLDAFSEVLRAIPRARLVLPGGEAGAEPEVRSRLSRPDLAGRVDRPGRVSAGELEHMYRSSTAVVVPSRYEGFGLPALEAMARGLPVVVADAGALPEVVGEGTDFAPLDPDDVTAWSEAMQAVAGMDDRRREAVVARGLDRAGEFRPRRTADAMVGAWRRALGRP